MTDLDYLKNLRDPSDEDPLRILVSACLTGITCGYDGTDYGDYPSVLRLLSYKTARLVRFCPEDFSFGTPRELCDIYGGTGADVLDGKARVITQSGVDWTDGMIKAAHRMVNIACQSSVELAIMMDISAACGSQVIYDGNRLSDDKKYQVGSGVAAAMLQRAGFKVISQRDYVSLEILYKKLDPTHIINTSAIDHHQTPWYKEYFKK